MLMVVVVEVVSDSGISCGSGGSGSSSSRKMTSFCKAKVYLKAKLTVT